MSVLISLWAEDKEVEEVTDDAKFLSALLRNSLCGADCGLETSNLNKWHLEHLLKHSVYINLVLLLLFDSQFTSVLYFRF